MLTDVLACGRILTMPWGTRIAVKTLPNLGGGQFCKILFSPRVLGKLTGNQAPQNWPNRLHGSRHPNRLHRGHLTRVAVREEKLPSQLNLQAHLFMGYNVFLDSCDEKFLLYSYPIFRVLTNFIFALFDVSLSPSLHWYDFYTSNLRLLCKHFRPSSCISLNVLHRVP